MQAILAIHIAAGTLSVLTGVAALVFRKGERAHRAAGGVFAAAMAVMALGAALLGDVAAGVITLYFVATAWVAARRRDGQAGRLEIGAFVVALACGPGLLALAYITGAPEPENPYVATARLILCGVLALAAAGDLSVVLRRGVSGAQRIARHLWRMCFAFFIALGSFAAQGADALPEVIPGPQLLLASILLVLGVMVFWLVRVLFTGWWARAPQRS